MAVALRSQSSLSLANRTNSTLTAPSGIVNGDLLVAFVVAGDGNDQTVPTVTAPAGFSAITGSPFTISRADPYAIGLNIFVKVASGESGNYTFTHGAADSEGHMLCYSGVDTTTPVSPNATSNTGTGTAVTATGLTTAANDSAVIYSVLLWDGATSTPPTGTTPTFTERHDLGSSGVLYIADGILATAGATGNKTGTFSLQGSSNPWRAVLLSLKAAGSSGITGTLSQSIGNVSISGAGTVALAGTLNQSLAAITVSASGSVALSGSLSQSIGAVALNATGASQATGSLSQSIGSIGLSATGTLPLAGALSASVGTIGLSAAGAVAIAGGLNQTIGPVAVAATATLAISGAVSASIGAVDLTASGSAGVSIVGELSQPIGEVAISADGVVARSQSGRIPRGAGAVQKWFAEVEEKRRLAQEPVLVSAPVERPRASAEAIFVALGTVNAFHVPVAAEQVVKKAAQRPLTQTVEAETRRIQAKNDADALAALLLVA